MCDKITVTAECLGTFVTLEWIFSSVDPLMDHQTVDVDEAFVTELAPENISHSMTSSADSMYNCRHTVILIFTIAT